MGNLVNLTNWQHWFQRATSPLTSSEWLWPCRCVDVPDVILVVYLWWMTEAEQQELRWRSPETLRIGTVFAGVRTQAYSCYCNMQPLRGSSVLWGHTDIDFWAPSTILESQWKFMPSLMKFTQVLIQWVTSLDVTFTKPVHQFIPENKPRTVIY